MMILRPFLDGTETEIPNFSARYAFEIRKNTDTALFRGGSSLQFLATERVQKETAGRVLPRVRAEE